MRYYMAFVGVVLLAGAVWLFARRLALVIGGEAAVGRIESFEARGSDHSPAYHAVVVFQDLEHRVHRFTSMAGSPDQQPPVGSKVMVRYRRNDPEVAAIASFWHLWGLPVVLAFMGCCSLLGSLK